MGSARVGVANQIWTATQRRCAEQAARAGGIDAVRGPDSAGAVPQDGGQGKSGLKGLDTSDFPASQDVAHQPFLVAMPRQIPHKLPGQNLPPAPPPSPIT